MLQNISTRGGGEKTFAEQYMVFSIQNGAHIYILGDLGVFTSRPFERSVRVKVQSSMK